MRYSKRTESTLVIAILQYCQCQENLKRIAWVDRCNSGLIKIGNRCPRCGHTGKSRIFRGHRKGTPDIMVVLNDGRTLWIEAKRDDYEQSTAQYEFQMMIEPMGQSVYIIASSTDDVEGALKLLC
jgi:hypothetical protein